MMPLYGFLEGDTIGLLILADADETVEQLAERLQQSALVRVPRARRVKVVYRGRVLDPRATLAASGVEPLERFDVVKELA
jgi:hypothetical protein